MKYKYLLQSDVMDNAISLSNCISRFFFFFGTKTIILKAQPRLSVINRNTFDFDLLHIFFYHITNDRSIIVYRYMIDYI